MKFLVFILLLLHSSLSFLTTTTTSSFTRNHRKHSFQRQVFVTTSATYEREKDTKDENLLLEIIGDHVASFVTNTNLTETEARRVFHGRGGLYPGCEHATLDYYPPVWLLTSHNKQLSNNTVLEVISRMKDYSISSNQTEEFNFVYQFRNDTGSDTRVLSGTVPQPHIVTENKIKILVNLISGKNHGIFLDMANGRAWVQQKTGGENVLNLFAYTCGFSLSALKGGALQVVNIDMAAGPMKNGKRNHELNNFTQGARFLTHNIFKTWGKIRKLGPYDTIIVDPPSFQKKSFIAKKDYSKIIRRLPDLLTKDGKVLLCLNAPELDTSWLKDQVSEFATELEFVERIPNPESFPSLDIERGLKVLAYRKKH